MITSASFGARRLLRRVMRSCSRGNDLCPASRHGAGGEPVSNRLQNCCFFKYMSEFTSLFTYSMYVPEYRVVQWCANRCSTPATSTTDAAPQLLMCFVRVGEQDCTAALWRRSAAVTSLCAAAALLPCMQYSDRRLFIEDRLD